MDKYGVKSTHDAIKNKLIDYINTVYLGKNDNAANWYEITEEEAARLQEEALNNVLYE